MKNGCCLTAIGRLGRHSRALQRGTNERRFFGDNGGELIQRGEQQAGREAERDDPAREGGRDQGTLWWE